MPRNHSLRILIICDPSFDVLPVKNALRNCTLRTRIERVSLPSDFHELCVEQSDIALMDINVLRHQKIDSKDLGDTLYTHLPVVFLGDEANARMVLEGIQAGAQDWLPNNHINECAATRIVENSVRNYLHHRNLIVNHARYQSVVEDQSELIYRCDPDFLITFANGAYANRLGIPASTLEGTSVRKHKRIRDFDSYRRNILSLSPEFPEAHEEEYSHVDGDVIWQQWTDKAFFDSNGKIIEVQSIGKDITARRCAEQEAIDGRKRFQSLYDNAPIMMQELDARGRILSVNQYWLDTLGWKKEQVLGQHAFRFLERPSRQSIRNFMECFTLSGQVKNIRCRYVRATQKPINIVASATSYLWDRNQNYQILIVSTELESVSPFSHRQPAEEKSSTHAPSNLI